MTDWGVFLNEPLVTTSVDDYVGNRIRTSFIQKAMDFERPQPFSRLERDFLARLDQWLIIQSKSGVILVDLIPRLQGFVEAHDILRFLSLIHATAKLEKDYKLAVEILELAEKHELGFSCDTLFEVYKDSIEHESEPVLMTKILGDDRTPEETKTTSKIWLGIGE